MENTQKKKIAVANSSDWSGVRKAFLNSFSAQVGGGPGKILTGKSVPSWKVQRNMCQSKGKESWGHSPCAPSSCLKKRIHPILGKMPLQEETSMQAEDCMKLSTTSSHWYVVLQKAKKVNVTRLSYWAVVCLRKHGDKIGIKTCQASSRASVCLRWKEHKNQQEE